MHAIGIDIGGTKIAGGLVSSSGELLAQTRRKTDAEAPESIEAAVLDIVRELRANQAIAGVGIAAAGFVDSTRSTVLFAPNIAWRDHPLRQRIEAHLDLPVVVENDANAAGWAEFQFGAGCDARNMVMVTVGTGLGAAIVSDGALVRGASGVAAEMGHMLLVPNGHYCGCGHEGCWERYASGEALVRDARAAIRRDTPRAKALLDICGGERKKLTGPMISELAAAGDPLALEMVTRCGTWLGIGMASVAAVLDPEVFIVGGGVAAVGDLLLEPAREAFCRHLPARGHRLEAAIVPAQMGNGAGIVGAADLARYR